MDELLWSPLNSAGWTSHQGFVMSRCEKPIITSKVGQRTRRNGWQMNVITQGSCLYVFITNSLTVFPSLIPCLLCQENDSHLLLLWRRLGEKRKTYFHSHLSSFSVSDVLNIFPYTKQTNSPPRNFKHVLV